MNGTLACAQGYIGKLAEATSELVGVKIVVCPPYPYLEVMARESHGSHISIFAQNMHHALEGAFTGEVSAGMLREIGVDGVLIGHPERPPVIDACHELTGLQVEAAHAQHLTPVICVGESRAEKLAARSDMVLHLQVGRALSRLPKSAWGEVVFIYEALWAIGGGFAASHEEIDSAVATIGRALSTLGPDAAPDTRILYGGGVSPDNTQSILRRSFLDGVVIGAASVDPEFIAEVARLASLTKRTFPDTEAANKISVN
jgi:triosephosphate isomerase